MRRPRNHRYAQSAHEARLKAAEGVAEWSHRPLLNQS